MAYEFDPFRDMIINYFRNNSLSDTGHEHLFNALFGKNYHDDENKVEKETVNKINNHKEKIVRESKEITFDLTSAIAKALFNVENDYIKISHFQYDENYSDKYGLIIIQYEIDYNGKTKTVEPIQIKVPKNV